MRLLFIICLLSFAWTGCAQTKADLLLKNKKTENVWEQHEYAVEHFVLISLKQKAENSDNQMPGWLSDIILGRPPLLPPPPPPLPCPEMINCDGFAEGIVRMVTPEDQPYDVQIHAGTPSRSLNPNSIIAYGKSSEKASEHYKNYNKVTFTIKQPDYKGPAYVTMKNLKTGKVYVLRFKMF